MADVDEGLHQSENVQDLAGFVRVALIRFKHICEYICVGSESAAANGTLRSCCVLGCRVVYVNTY
jgi:hypothetical protein